MLRLTQAQLDRLDALEQAQYLDEVHRAVLAEDPTAGADAGLRARIGAAHRHALRLGFTDGAALIQFLFYEAFAPSFHAQPAVHAWLSRPGAPVEQRFADLVQALKARTRGP
jgi:hypothetical protein